jgi:hypothetical protein
VSSGDSDFFVVAATIIPVIYLSAMVEMGVSGARAEEVPESEEARAAALTDVSLFVAYSMVALLGEYVALRALTADPVDTTGSRRWRFRWLHCSRLLCCWSSITACA